MRLLLVALLACSANNTSPHTTPVENTAEPAAVAEFITVAELWSPDESSLGVVVSMREAPAGTSADFMLPAGDLDPGDARAVLFGARLIRENGSVLSAAMDGAPRRFELSRASLSNAVDVWLFDDAELVAIERLEPCDGCAGWRSPATEFLLVVPSGQQLSLTPQPGWTIAVSP